MTYKRIINAKMNKFIIIILFALIPNLSFGEITLSDFLKRHCELFKSEIRDYIFSPDILSNQIIRNFPINQGADTIYINSYRSAGESEATLIWNSNEHLRIYPDKVIIIPRFNESYRQFYSNWDTDVLKHLGKEYHSTNVTSETYNEYLTRIIIDNGNIKIDTTTYLDFDSDNLNNCTQQQLDSIREVVHLIKNTKLVPTAYHLEINKNSNDPENISSFHKTPSLWQRIVDWFSRLWRAIFG